MPNITNILKAEISRVARKEVRAEIETLKKATTGTERISRNSNTPGSPNAATTTAS
ncbi:hypothetical protein [Variovorax sp. V116]|uniref:hypothetical protein n=1 Tax=Variovorax sp. V116 TaxID=3065953 RepID=UPI0034E87F1E